MNSLFATLRLRYHWIVKGDAVSLDEAMSMIEQRQWDELAALMKRLTWREVERLTAGLSAECLKRGIEISRTNQNASDGASRLAQAQFYLDAATRLQQADATNPDLWHQCGTTLWNLSQQDTEAGEALLVKACAMFEKATGAERNHLNAWLHWGDTLNAVAEGKPPAEEIVLRTQAQEKYQQALRIAPDSIAALWMCGSMWHWFAVRESGHRADELWNRAEAQFTRLLSLYPDRFELWHGWITVLCDWALRNDGEDALWEKVGASCKQMLRIRPGDSDVCRTWAASLAWRASLRTGHEANAFFQQACEKYKLALIHNPTSKEALLGWARALANHALTKEESEAETLWEQSNEKYRRTLEFEPDALPVLIEWSTWLYHQIRRREPGKKEELCNTVRAILERAENVKPGACAHNLACIAARRGREEEARKWLETGLERQTLCLEDVAKDEDLHSLREADWFQELLQKLRQTAPAADRD
jgi:tetratricopeptide (TPR) repeat protein